MEEQKKCSFWKCANIVGLFLVGLFAVCFFWYYIRPIEQDLHLRLLKLAYFGFNGMNFWSFVWGALQSYLWAYVGVGIWRFVVKCCPLNK